METLIIILFSHTIASTLELSANNTFIWVEQEMDWYSANAFCQTNFGTELASIHSSTEDTEATNLCLSHATMCYIGLNDQSVEGEFVWVDGTVFNYSNIWLADNSPHGPVDEDCIILQSEGWGDVPCEIVLPQTFICNSPSECTCLLPSCCCELIFYPGYVYSGDDGIIGHNTLEEAKAFCLTTTDCVGIHQGNAAPYSSIRSGTIATDPSYSIWNKQCNSPSECTCLLPSCCCELVFYPGYYYSGDDGIIGHNTLEEAKAFCLTNTDCVGIHQGNAAPYSSIRSGTFATDPSYSIWNKECLSKIPTTDPTTPSISPTTAPTTSCIDYQQASNDGNNESTVNIDFILNINNYGIYQCLNCVIKCNETASCFEAIIKIDNIQNKSVVILCDKPYSCGSSLVYTTSMVSMLNISIICVDKYSCIDMKIDIQNITAFQIYCVTSSSCLDVNVIIDSNNNDIIGNTNDGIISCIAVNACDNLIITTTSNQTQLIMYQHSEDVILSNNVGYLYDKNNILCNNDRYIRVESNESMTIDYFSNLIAMEYESTLLPCSDVTVFCGNYSCSITYNYPPSLTTLIPPNSGCFWVNIQEIQNIICQGECISSPTSPPTSTPTTQPTGSTDAPSGTPTAAPTALPSSAPTVNPSFVPTFTPSIPPTSPPSVVPTTPPTFAPTTPPSIAPTFPPSVAPTTPPTFAPTTPPSIPPTSPPSVVPTTPPTFAPTSPPSVAPLFSPTIPPTFSPSFSPTKAPSFSPTTAPSRFPTQDYEKIYHSFIDIIYVIQGVSPLYIIELEDNTLSMIAQIIEIIESRYFVEDVVQYKDFMVKVNDMNGFQDLSNIPLKKGQNIKLNCQILSGSDVDGVLLRTSKKIEFETAVTIDLEGYIFKNNSELKFYVEDNESLHIDNDDVIEESESYEVIVISILIICAGLLSSAFVKWSNKRANAKIDNARWRAPLLFAFQIYDFISDINLCYDIFSNELINNGDLRATIILWCGIFAAAFTALPFISNLVYGVRIKKQNVIQNNRRADEYFTANIAIFMALIISCGGCYPTLLIISSSIFGLNIFQSGLTKPELNELSKIKIKSTITLENLPQLIVQIIYATQTTSVSIAVFLAFTGSVLSIILALSSYFANRENRKNSEIMSYYLRFCNENCNKLDDEQESNIQKNKGRKEKLQKAMSKVFGVSHDNIEIGYVWIRKDGLEMYISHYCSQSELAQYNHVNSRGYRSMITPKQYLTNLYQKMKVELNKTFGTHFEIENEDFTVEIILTYSDTMHDNNISLPLTREIELQQYSEYTEGANKKSVLAPHTTVPINTNKRLDEIHNMMQMIQSMNVNIMQLMNNQENKKKKEEKKDEEIDISGESNGSQHSSIES